jgi:hypothetical protein
VENAGKRGRKIRVMILNARQMCVTTHGQQIRQAEICDAELP